MSEHLKASIVRILQSNREAPVGVGFLVSNKHVFTCAHVVAQALGIQDLLPAQPTALINLDFPLTVLEGKVFTAKIVYWKPIHTSLPVLRDHIEDVAILELEELPSTSTQSVQLITAKTLWGHTFRAFGLPAGHDRGVWASGVLRDEIMGGLVLIEDIKIPGYSVIEGFSGTPVWDEQLEGVVGMVVETDRQTDTKAAYIIPSTQLAQTWSEMCRQVAYQMGKEMLDLLPSLTNFTPSAQDIPSLSLPPEFAHTYPLQESFTGRVHERHMLTEWFTKGNQPLLALIALGGMGKSSLAWFWMQHDVLHLPLIDQYQDILEAVDCAVPAPSRPEGVFWWSFYENEAHFIAFLDAALTYIDNRDAKPAILSSSTHEKVRMLLRLLQQRRILLILDGFERELRAYNYLSAAYSGDSPGGDLQENFRSCTNPYVADFLRGLTALTLKSRILITSRLMPQELDGLVGCRPVELDPLDPDDAVDFFYAQGARGSRANIQRLCMLYGYHPLTLRLLVGLIRNDPASPGDLAVVTHYDPIPNLLQRKHHILEIAYDALNPSTRELLSRIAAFRSRVDFHMMKVISPFPTDTELKEALKNLIERGFLLFDRQRRSYDLHPVVRHYAYDRLLNKKTLHTHLLNYFASIPQEKQIQSLEDLTTTIELYHHAVLAQKHDMAWSVYNERLRTPLYYHLCEYELDLQLLDAIPRAADSLPRLSSPLAQIWTILYTSMCYERTGRAKLAVEIIENAIRLARKVKDNVNLASALIPYSMSLCNLGRLQQANHAAFEATMIFDRVGDLNWRGISHRSYGRVLMYCGNIPRAVEEFNTAKEVYDLGSGFEHGHSILLIHLSQLHLLQSNPTKALQLVRQAKEHSQAGAYKREQVLAMWLEGITLVALASESADTRDAILEEAQSLLNEALTQCRRSQLLEVEPDILLAFASWYYQNGESHEAWNYASQALTLANKIEYRLKQAEIYNMMARMALDSSNYDTASQYAQQAYNYAWCDGPPYCYQSALDTARQMLNRVQKH